jgi:hypothetical protein
MKTRILQRLRYSQCKFMRLRSFLVLLLAACFILPANRADAYSVLTHEQLVDLTWQSSIVPLLLSRYPTLTPAQIEEARAYAYGGCVIQDIGYYPFGDAFFSDLTHYVRSGDFVVNLFRNAGNANELAFAVGALSHYIGDSIGHPTATNLAVPIEFPKLRDKYGKEVNYAQGEHQHVQTEFGFDINEIAHQRFAPVHYLRHVGLRVPTHQLALAFYQTYGLTDDFAKGKGHRINVGGYRFAVRNFIPRIAYAVTILHRKKEPMDIVGDPDYIRLQSEITAVAQQNHWDEYRKHAGIGTYTLAGFLYILPKVGPIKLVAVKGPSVDTEREYIHSVLHSADSLDYALRRFTPPPAVKATAAVAAAGDSEAHPSSSDSVPAAPGASQVVPRQSSDARHPLRNRDLDTGREVRPAGYRLTDDTYATLAHRLVATPGQPIPPGIQENVLAYYANLDLPFATKKDPARWATLQADLVTLRAMATSRDAVPYATYGDDLDEDTPAVAAPVKQ